MARFGYEPMELTVVKVKPAPVVLPETASRIESVAVDGLEIRESNFPSYKLTLRNLSHKDISYLEIQTFKEGRLSSSKWPREEQNRPLVKAGESYDAIVTAGGSGQKAQDGLTPSPPQRIEVVTAVFGDKSYEGDPHSAARFIASLHGQKIQIARAFALLQNASEAKGALDDLTQQVSALSREARQETIDEIFAEFSGFTPQWNESLKAFMEHGLDVVRKELLSDIAKYAKAIERDSKSNSFGTWIGDLKQKYEAWLSRL
jgi:hypothetical protein